MDIPLDFNSDEILKSDRLLELPAEAFEFKLGTYDLVILVDIPHFSTPEVCNCLKKCNGIITTGKSNETEAFRIFTLLFKIRFYSDGYSEYDTSPKNEDIKNFVSAFFETGFRQDEVIGGIQSFSIGGFLGVVDVDGKICKKQTFGASYDIVKDIQTSIDGIAYYDIGLERFLERKYLLEEPELYLRNDTLRVHCEITFSINGATETFSIFKKEYFEREGREEKWFCYDTIVDEVTGEEHDKRSLILNRDSTLGKLLQEKSPYFRSVFETTMKEGTTKLLPIEDDEFETFYNMVSFIRFDTLDHVKNVEDCVELYVAEDKYEVTGLIEACRKFFRRSIKVDCAADLLMFFDVYKDQRMKEFAIQFILANWYEVKLSDGWKVLEEERRDLIREILYMIEDNSNNFLRIDSSCLKAFKAEMECFSVFPKYRKNYFSCSKLYDEKLERHILQKREQFRNVEFEEIWFKHETKINTVEHSLKLCNPKSPLSLLLQRKSPYFKNVFTTSMKEGVTKLLPINENEYQAFYNLMCYIRFETLDHLRDINEYLDLYVLADKYDISDLHKYSRDFIRQNLKFDNVAEILIFSDTYKDQNVKEICIQFILSNWFDVKESNGWKVLEEERQDLIQDILLMTEAEDIKILPGSNENLKKFSKEMKCYRSLPIDKTIQNQSAPNSLIFFDLISVHNQELVISFIVDMAYHGYETATNMGYFDYKDFIYIKQESLIREIMRFIKREYLKHFVLKRDCLQVFKESMKNASSEILERRNIIATKNLENVHDENRDFIIQLILYRWAKLIFTDDWRSMRSEMIHDDTDEDVKENLNKLLLLEEESAGKPKPAANLADLDSNNLSNFKNEIIIIEYLLASWDEEQSFQFLDLVMAARLNLYEQALFVYSEREILSSKSEAIARQFEDQNEFAEIHDFYE